MKPYYQDELVTIYHSPAAEVLTTLATAPGRTVVLTDPPWPGVSDSIDIVGRDTACSSWRDVVAEVPRIATRLVVQLGALTDPRDMLATVPRALPYRCAVWLRYMPPSRRGPHLVGADLAYVFGEIRLPPRADGSRGRVLPAEIAGASVSDRWRGNHPCPRNLGHVEGLVRWYCAAADLLIDPMCGSGTTLIAAKRRGVASIGIDIDERWCAEAAARCAAEPVQGRLDMGVFG